ncbi:MAG: cob(I)yrinic acid a,c-diamide adenosyltransferase [Anaerolineales bacterium]|nr:MAG: cob(I)yrinic acid a,c-diamide adenosyltransferase [Anaerolineales bacterium]
MSKFYTRSGDEGFTGLLGNERVPKYHPRPDTVGAIDEATAVIGVARAHCTTPEIEALLLQSQRDLYNLMAEISATPENAHHFRKINAERVTWLENQTEEIGSKIEMPDEFIVPGDSPSGAFLAQARTVIRRAERLVAQLLHNQEIENIELLRYLNRLSSLCFVLEILENQASGKDIPTLARGA